MAKFGISHLFDRRPTIATIGLALASLSAFATLFQGLSAIFSVTGFYFDFIYRESEVETVSPAMGILVTCFSLIQMFAIYKALEPNNIARMIVISMTGVKLLAFISSNSNNLPIWQYLLLLTFTTAPILLLLSRSPNSYYSHK